MAVIERQKKPVLHKTFFGQLSIKRRISIAILLTFILTIPTVLTSLFYFTKLLNEITTVIEKDVKIGMTASEMSITMQEIRRHERNYRIFGTIQDRDSVKELITKIETIIKDISVTSPVEENTIEILTTHLNIYSNSFNTLAEYISQHPPEDRILQIKKQMSDNVQHLQKDYKTILTKIEKASKTERDSIITQSLRNLETFSIDRLFSSGDTNDLDNQLSYIQENLDISRQAFLDASHKLAEKSWENILIHKNLSKQIEARAKRNIISILLITTVFCIALVLILPRKIVKPITSLNQILRRAGTGDLSSQAEIYTHDEIGDLATNYNLILSKLRLYDDLKTKKIASQKRMVERLLDIAHNPVCILTPNLVATFYNMAFVSLFSPLIPPKPPEGGLELENAEIDKSFLEKIRDSISGAVTDFTIDFTSSGDKKVIFKGRLVRNALMELESIVLYGA